MSAANTTDRLTFEEIQADRAIAAGMTCTCSLCGRDGRKVLAHHLQATRQRPCQFLGFQGWCSDCQMTVDVETAQTTMAF